MRSAYLDYAMSVIVGRALPDVRDGLKPVHRRVLYAMNELGLAPNRSVRQVRQDRRRGDGQLPPARRLGDLRHAGAHGAGLLHALPARRRAGQLRLDRRRPGGRHALHGGAALRGSRPRCCATSTPTPSTSPQLRRRPQEPLVLPARFPNLLVNGSSGIAVGMATNIPPHNLREVIGGDDRLHRRPGHRRRRPDAAHQGPRLPDRRHDPRHVGHPRGLRDRPRPRPGPGPRAHRAAHARQGGDRRHRAALSGQEGRRRRPDPEDRRPRPREEDHRDLRPARRVRQARHAPRHRAQARRHPEGRAQQALQAHADADDVRREHGRARRQRAAHAVAARGDRRLRRPPARGRRAPDQARARREGGARAHPRGPAGRARQPRRGHRADPRLARPRRGARRPDGEVRAHGDPGAGDPRPAPRPADRAGVRLDQGRVRGQGRAHQGAARDPRRRDARAGPDQGGARRDPPRPTATSAAPRSPTPRTTSTSRT